MMEVYCWQKLFSVQHVLICCLAPTTLVKRGNCRVLINDSAFQPLEPEKLVSLARHNIFNMNNICSVRSGGKGILQNHTECFNLHQKKEKKIHLLFWPGFILNYILIVGENEGFYS